MATRTKKTPMETHKEALAEGRNHLESSAGTSTPWRRTSPTAAASAPPDTVKKRLATVEAAELKDSSGLARLNLLQDRRDLEVELASMQAVRARLERAGKGIREGPQEGYSAKKRISYGAWREFGVPARSIEESRDSRGAHEAVDRAARAHTRVPAQLPRHDIARDRRPRARGDASMSRGASASRRPRRPRCARTSPPHAGPHRVFHDRDRASARSRVDPRRAQARPTASRRARPRPRSPPAS